MNERPKTILHVEDDASLQRLVRVVLEHATAREAMRTLMLQVKTARVVALGERALVLRDMPSRIEPALDALRKLEASSATRRD